MRIGWAAGGAKPRVLMLPLTADSATRFAGIVASEPEGAGALLGRRGTSPTVPGRGGQAAGAGPFAECLRRVVTFQQMDFESTLDQMLTLCSLHPHRVYKQSYYRKQTKNQWARDDPAFGVVQVGFLMVATTAYGVAFQVGGLVRYLYLVLSTVLFHWLLGGVFAASVGSWIANKHLLQHHQHSVEQTVEWLYAFDIHCNAFFVFFLIVYVAQFFLLPPLLSTSFLSLVLSNGLYAAGFVVYFYITHLGYRALPFLRRTEVYLYPAGGAGLLMLFSCILGVLGLKINMTRLVSGFFFGSG